MHPSNKEGTTVCEQPSSMNNLPGKQGLREVGATLSSLGGDMNASIKQNDAPQLRGKWASHKEGGEFREHDQLHVGT